MNRLLAKKKGKDEDDRQEVTSTATAPVESRKESAPMKKKGWRRRKERAEPEPEPFDIKNALPSNETFRTSLIMSNLSTRFSMLREADGSLIGKASDDSVLGHRRRSRLGEFGFSTTALNDISESNSLSNSVRPPLSVQRTGSYTYGDPGYATDDDSSAGGSMMTRARPGEGNMLFGGRQKIYRIPIGDAGSVNNLGANESRGMRGRALYEDDVSMSAFQRMREEEKARLREAKLAELDADMDDLRKDSLSSPSFTYSDKRETISSTNSGPSMISQSTAPTSVANSAAASSPVLQSSNGSTSDRSKSRRLYEQGLDQHMQEQQSAAATRLTSMKRSPSDKSTANAPYHSRSAGNLRDRSDVSALQSAGAMLSERAPTPGSKPSSPLSPFTETTPPSSRPLSPDASSHDREKALFQAMNPQHRGMATATGQFNRPKQFNEEQFLQRQMSLAKQQQRQRKDSTTPPSGISPIREAGPQKRAAPGARPRTGTNRTDRSWSNSSITNESSSFTASKSQSPSKMSKAPSRDVQPATNGTFFGNDTDDDSDYGPDPVPNRTEPSEPTDQDTLGGAQQPRPSTHPALRSVNLPPPTSPKQKRNAWSPEQLKSGLMAAGESSLGGFNHVGENTSDDAQPRGSEGEDADADGDLKGLVREHLRHPSNSSSIYPASHAAGAETQSHDFDLRVPSMYVSENPWEHDDFQAPPLPRLGNGSPYQSATNGDSTNSSSPDLRPPPTPVTDWQEELRNHHVKTASTETAYERRAFASELAQRQRTIQENLRIKVENDQRTPPITGVVQSPKNVFESSLRPFGMLRVKSSKEALPTPRDQPRQSLQGERDRSASRQRSKRESPMSPQPMGRTLHSKLPRQDEDSAWSPPGDHGSVFDRPSLDYNMRPSVDSSRPSQTQSIPSMSAHPDSSRTSNSRYRSGSEQSQPPPSRESQRESKLSEPSRPSIDTRLRRDSGNGNTRGPLSAPLIESRSPLSPPPKDPNRPSPISANSYPKAFPTLATTFSAPNLHTTGAYGNPASLSPLSTGPSYGNLDPQSAPSTGFFFPPSPNSMADASALSLGANGRSRGPPSATAARIAARRPRKNTITKSDISEPTLIASTSSAPTVDLPEGASLKNGLRDDFDVVLMGRARDCDATAPSPSVPTGGEVGAGGVGGGAAGAKGRKGGWLRGLGRKESAERDGLTAGGLGDGAEEPEPRRFRVRRLEDGEGKVGHRTLRAGVGEQELAVE